MAIDFPNSPTTNQIYIDSSSGAIYIYDGVKWSSTVAAYNAGLSSSLDYGVLDGSTVTGTIDYGGLT